MHLLFQRACTGLTLALAAACSSSSTPPAHEPVAPAYTEDFATIWTRPADPRGDRHGLSQHELRIQRLALSRENLGLDLALVAPDPASSRNGQRETPTISLRVDGCPGPSYSLERPLSFGGEAQRFVLPRARLPKGDLEVTVRAFEQIDTILLRHDDEGIRPISFEEQKLYREQPGDEAKGLPPVSWIEPVECK